MLGPNLAHKISDDLHPCTHSVTEPDSLNGVAQRTRQYDGRIPAVPDDQQAPHPVEAALLEVQRLAGPSIALLACMCSMCDLEHQQSIEMCSGSCLHALWLERASIRNLPVQSARKFSAVRGTTSLRSCACELSTIQSV